MKTHTLSILALSIAYLLLEVAFSLRISSSQKRMVRFELMMNSNDNETSENKRRRRTKVKKPSVQMESKLDFKNDEDLPTAEELSSLTKSQSKLPPLSGSTEEMQAKYNEKGVVERTVGDLLAPTPTGQEPKLVTLMKNVTWFSVLLLVLLEIVVSIKVGGSPFGIGQVTVPPPPPLTELMQAIQ